MWRPCSHRGLGTTMVLIIFPLTGLACRPAAEATLPPTEATHPPIETTGPMDQGSGGVVITGTVRTLAGPSPSLMNTEEVSIAVLDGQVVSRLTRLNPQHPVPAISFTRLENLELAIYQGLDGKREAVRGKEMNSPEAPEFLENFLPQWQRGLGDPYTEEVIEYPSRPILDSGRIRELEAMERIAKTSTAELLGMPVTVFEIDPPSVGGYDTRHVRAWLKMPEGYKLKVEQWEGGDDGRPSEVFEATAFDTRREAAEGFFAANPMTPFLPADEAKTDFVRVDPFDRDVHPLPDRLARMPVLNAHDLIASQPMELKSSLFITGTFDTRLMQAEVHAFTGAVGVPKWWVMQEFKVIGVSEDEWLEDSDPRAAWLVTLQGPDDQVDAPVDLLELWPPAWTEGPPLERLAHIFRSESPGKFDDGDAYSVYEPTDIETLDGQPRPVTPSADNPSVVTASWKYLLRSRLPAFDHLLTWRQAGGIRVVVLAKGMTSADTVVLAEQYRGSAARYLGTTKVEN